jgi:hypothetical protein
MIEFALFCIATVGMTSIIVQGVIFLPIRRYVGNLAERNRLRREQAAQDANRSPRRAFIEWLSDLLNCAQCAGFWCGIFCGLILLSSDSFAGTGVNRLLMWFCCGLGGSFLSAFGCNMLDLVFYHKMNALRQLEEQDLILAERQGISNNSAD